MLSSHAPIKAQVPGQECGAALAVQVGDVTSSLGEELLTDAACNPGHRKLAHARVHEGEACSAFTPLLEEHHVLFPLDASDVKGTSTHFGPQNDEPPPILKSFVPHARLENLPEALADKQRMKLTALQGLKKSRKSSSV